MTHEQGQSRVFSSWLPGLASAALLVLSLALLPVSAGAMSRLPSGASNSDASFDAELAQARLRHQTGEQVPAMRMLETLLDRVRNEGGPWDLRNKLVLAELAEIHHALGNLEQAKQLYNKAIHIDRVNQGLHNVTQTPLLMKLAELQASSGDYEAANQTQEYAWYVQQRAHSSSSPAILPSLYYLADWWQRNGRARDARMLYERAVRIIEMHYGAWDIRLIEPLRSLAGAYLKEHAPGQQSRLFQPAQDDHTFLATNTSPERNHGASLIAEGRPDRLSSYRPGHRALTRIQAIIDAHPDSSIDDRAQVLLELADWALLFNKWRQATETYGRVHTLLIDNGWDEQRIDEYFSEPVALLLQLPTPPRPASYSDAIAHQGYVNLVYEVNEHGRVREMEIVDSQPPGLMDFRTRKALRSARFRPRLVAGIPVATQAVSYQHEFVYYPRPGNDH